MNKITKKQKFEAMIAYFKGEEAEVTLTETDFIEFCEDQIADLDKKAAKAKERAAAKKAEADELSRTERTDHKAVCSEAFHKESFQRVKHCVKADNLSVETASVIVKPQQENADCNAPE